MELRPYQLESIEAVRETLARRRSTLLVLPTGCGKTVVFAKIAEAFAPHGRVLVLAHREELIRQAVEKIQGWTALRCEVEMADQRASLDGLYPPDVVVGSIQSLSRPKRLARFTEFDFGLVIIDEAHHATASTYRDVLAYFDSAKVLGVTATPDRGDKTALGGVFEEAAFVYEIRQAIEEGYLVPVRQKAVKVEGLDLSKVRTTRGDLNEQDLERILREEEHLHKVAEPIHDLSGGRKTLVFCVTVAHAHDLVRVLKGYPGETAEALDGSASADVREKTIARFRSGETRVLVNCALFTEGFDLPAISCVAVARPTKSRGLYAQMIGRGTRLSPGKTDLLVLDFEGNAGRHSLVSANDVLAGDAPPEVRARAATVQKSNPSASVLEALDLAKAELAEEEKKRLAKRGDGVQVGTKKNVRDVDPFVVIGIEPKTVRRGGGAVTEKQVEMLTKLGFPAESKVWEMDAGAASATIDKLIERKRKGLCTYKQARLLLRYGLNPDLPYQEAKQAIDAIASNGWRVPAELVRAP